MGLTNMREEIQMYNIRLYLCFKAAALITPLVLSIVLLIGVFGSALNPVSVVSESDSRAARDSYVDKYYRDAEERLESKFNIVLSVVGVAVTVWVGLSIYNAVERREVEMIGNTVTSLEEKVKELEKKAKELEKKAKELEKKAQNVTAVFS